MRKMINNEYREIKTLGELCEILIRRHGKNAKALGTILVWETTDTCVIPEIYHFNQTIKR